MNFPQRSNMPEDQTVRLFLQGAGAAAPVILQGQRTTISRVALGRYLITFGENYGYFMGFDGYGFRDATQANVKNLSCTAGLYSNTNGVFTIEVDVWSSAGAAVDLAVTNLLDLTFAFKGTKG